MNKIIKYINIMVVLSFTLLIAFTSVCETTYAETVSSSDTTTSFGYEKTSTGKEGKIKPEKPKPKAKLIINPNKNRNQKDLMNNELGRLPQTSFVNNSFLIFVGIILMFEVVLFTYLIKDEQKSHGKEVNF